MSLIRPAGGEVYRGVTVTVYPAEVYTSRDGNTISRVSAVGTEYHHCHVQPVNHGSEDDDRGYSPQGVTERLTLPYGAITLPPGSRVVIGDDVYSTIGYPKVYRGSKRTEHSDYAIRRVG